MNDRAENNSEMINSDSATGNAAKKRIQENEPGTEPGSHHDKYVLTVTTVSPPMRDTYRVNAHDLLGPAI